MFARKFCLLVATSTAIFQVTTVRAQHASDNPVTSAEDAYGLTLGLESVGLYNPGLVRGFGPQAAGNMRIDGLYFDQQGGLSNRVLEGSTIRVGVSEIGYAFPAPTGIVDYDLRHPGGDTPNATIIANVGPYEAWGVSIDGSVPLDGKEFVLPIGASSQVSTQAPFGVYRGLTSRIASIGATPLWSPNKNLVVRALIDWQQTRDAKVLPLYFTAGNFLPPAIPNRFLGQDWALGRSETLNFGALVDAHLNDYLTLKAGVFRSANDSPRGFTDIFSNVQPDGQSEQLMIGYPDQKAYSNSGEVRLTGAYQTQDWLVQLILTARGRDTTAHYGGQDLVDLGPAIIDAPLQTPEPDFLYSARSIDHSQLWSIGSAFHVDWRSVGELEMGVQKEDYHETVTTPGFSQSSIAAHPLRGYGNAAFALTSRLTLYAGYTQGLEGSGVAPNIAQNSGAVLPASETWQMDGGARYILTPDFKIIAGAFELEKPYFNLDVHNADEKLGQQKAKGIELSLAGEPLPHLNINVGVLYGEVRITGPDLAAEGVGPIAVGQPRLTYSASASYTLPWWPAASVDASALHFGTVPESVDNAIYTPPTTQVNVGGRYKFTAFGQNNALRVQIQNVLNSTWWTNGFTPGFSQWPGSRTIFAYITTDIQG